MGAEVEPASRAAAMHSPWEEGPLGQCLSHADRRGLGAQGGEGMRTARANRDLMDQPLGLFPPATGRL